MSAPGTGAEIPLFILGSIVTETSARVTNEPELPDGADVWIDGARLSAVIPEPLVYEIEAGDEGEMGGLIETAAPLMSEDVIEAMRESGVENLDLYRAIVREVGTGREYRQYRAVNVIGMISATDKSRSSSVSLDGLGTWFDRLVVDEAAIRGALLFRLREATSRIIVHESVKQAIEARGVPLVRFTRLEDFSG